MSFVRSVWRAMRLEAGANMHVRGLNVVSFSLPVYRVFLSFSIQSAGLEFRALNVILGTLHLLLIVLEFSQSLE